MSTSTSTALVLMLMRCDAPSGMACPGATRPTRRWPLLLAAAVVLAWLQLHTLCT